jgi:predicted GNAT superfamily acetyltransferase
MNRAIRIRPVDDYDGMRRVEELQAIVWPGSARDIVPAHLLLTAAHNGGVVLGAFDGERLIGFVFGFLGTDPSSPERVAMARLKHCSHMLGVHPDFQSQGIGYLLKIEQRRVVMAQGIRLVTWTFDPLLSRNAHLNIRRLGAVSHTYLRDAYGELQDDLNAGVATDRLQMDWWITSHRVRERLEGGRKPLDLANYLAAGVHSLNPASLRDDRLPLPAEHTTGPDGPLALLEIPHDYQAMRAADLGLARAWRLHLRELFESCFAGGYWATDFIHLAGEQFPRSYYLLSHGESTLG